MQIWRRRRDIFIIMLLMVGLWLPLLGNLFFSKVDNTQEKRQLAAMPKLTWQQQSIEQFPGKFEKYFNDHFGFRQQLIYWFNRLSLALDISPSAKVLVGREGWMFLRNRHTVNDFMHVESNDLASFKEWKRALEKKRDLLAKRGLQYLFVVAPDKHTIYPEFFPEGYVKTNAKSRLDAFFDYMQKNSDVNVLDLRPILKQAKAQKRIYHVTDTHWNQRGAAAARDLIIDKLSGDMAINALPKPVALTFKEFPGKAGDLSIMLGMRDEMSEMRPVPIWEGGRCAKKQQPDLAGVKLHGPHQPYLFHCNKASKRLLMFHDSFGNGLVPHLSEHFKESLYVRNNPTPTEMTDLLDFFQPDVVVEEKVERSLHRLPRESALFLTNH